MKNILLGFPNRIESALLSGGAWVGSLPLANLQDRAFAVVARSIDLSLASTTFTMDLRQQRSVRIIALVAHNFSFGGRIHIEASNADDFSDPLADFFVDAWSGVADAEWDLDSLEWENDNFWTGTYVQEDVEGQTPICPIVLENDIGARYWRVTIDDPSNPAGFVQIGRVFIGAGFLQPRINYSWGGSLGYEDATGVDSSLSGAEYFDVREPIRVMRFSLASLSEEEGAKALDLVRRAGVHKEVFLVADPDDRANAVTQNFMGRLRQLSSLEQAMFQTTSMSFEIKELR